MSPVNELVFKLMPGEHVSFLLIKTKYSHVGPSRQEDLSKLHGISQPPPANRKSKEVRRFDRHSGPRSYQAIGRAF